MFMITDYCCFSMSVGLQVLYDLSASSPHASRGLAALACYPHHEGNTPLHTGW
jgi:hypothetical protein